MNIGDRIFTPRFCTVTIKEMFPDRQSATEQGYTEPTYYEHPEYKVVGKSLGMYRMQFAAYRK